ncbi:MAG: cytochrome b5 domain-containing protein [Deltaproteobacteria bacterium]
MFHYFEYGSSLWGAGLGALGIRPLRCEPAVLEGFQLRFDVPDLFGEGIGTANVREQQGGQVHGQLCTYRTQHLAQLDLLHGLGVCYQRRRVVVCGYAGNFSAAHVHLGHPARLDPSRLPSRRQQQLLVRRARELRLETAYVASLEQLECADVLEAAPCLPPLLGKSFDSGTLSEHQEYVGLAGRVFDLGAAPPEHAGFRKLFGGKDITLYVLAAHCCATTLEALRACNLDGEQRALLDAFARDLARWFPTVGSLSYESPSPGDAEQGLLRAAAGDSSSRIARRQTTLSRPPPGAGLAHLVMEEADFEFSASGNENAGYLSERHGFLPRQLPRTELGPSHALWDQMVAELPRSYASLQLRRQLEQLPVLAATEDRLADVDLLRAAAILSFLAHAYWYVEPRPPAALPRSVSEPWAEVCRRLGRTALVLTYQDLIATNFRLLQPERRDVMSVDNLQLLFPTVGTEAERIFYMTQTAILAHAAPAVSAMARAQEAAEVDDEEVLEAEIMTILSALQRMTYTDLPEIDPNPHSARYMDPVVWAKTVAPFAVPITPGSQGPSGTSSPIFNALDVFLGRKRFDTFLGREIHALRASYPPLWRKFIAALHEVSVPDYVARKQKPALTGLLHDVVDAYSGSGGFLGRHRMKVYGYLELAFKVGRSVTIGGFRGAFQDRTWDQIDGELESSRRERTGSVGRPQRALVLDVSPRDPRESAGGARVRLDVSSAGLRLEPGDRCGVLPEHAAELVQRTLAALGARGDELVALTREWKNALELRAGYEGHATARVDELLRFGCIRAVSMRVAEALHALTQDCELERRLRDRSVLQLELWELLTLVGRHGFDLGRLYAPALGGSSSVLAGLVPPEQFRMYSVSSITGEEPCGVSTEIELLVAQLQYQSHGLDGRLHARAGTASSFLVAAFGRREPVTITIERPSRFRLPRWPHTPIVMIAGGTGISPFRAFLRERDRQPSAGPALLLLGLRRPAEFTFHADVLPGLRSARLALELAFSREPARLTWDSERCDFVGSGGTEQRVPDLIMDPVIASRLEELISEAGAVIYVCGRQRFAKACIDAIERMFAERRGSAPAQALMRTLIAQERLNLEVFSGDSPDDDPATIDVSELSRRNTRERGYWLAIEDRVYDLSEFVERHPGGSHTLLAHAGTDATEAYNKAHHARSEIDAMREMYCIGALHRLDLGRFSRVVETPSGYQVTSLVTVHRAWMRALYLVVEMQNAFARDQELQERVTSAGDPISPRSPYKLSRAVETHQRFVQGYLAVLFYETFPPLVDLTEGMLGTSLDEMPRITDEERARLAAGHQLIKERLDCAASRLACASAPAGLVEQLTRVLGALEEADRKLLDTLADRLRDGVNVFERCQARTPQAGAAALLDLCAKLPGLASTYEETVLQLTQCTELVHECPTLPPEPLAAQPMRAQLIASAHWLMEEDRQHRVVFLRRMALPFGSLEELSTANQQVVGHIRPEHQEWGIVVDMRQAPPRNDPSFESAMRALRDAVEVRFARTAVLLETAVGLLQVTRLTREDGATTFATQSEAAALRFARGQPIPSGA